MKRGSAGYSLLEVIVAFAVLALSLSTLFPTVSALSGRSAHATEHWAATEFARSKLEEIGVVTPIARGIDRGTWAQWDWRIEIAPYQNAALPPSNGLFEITIEVRRRGGTEPIARLVTVKPGGPLP